MFLNELSVNEKKVFLQLATAMAKQDGAFTKEEHELLNSFSKECGISYDELESLDFSELLESLKNSTDKSKRIILLGLIGMSIQDAKYMYSERKFLNLVADNFLIAQFEVDDIISMYDHYLSIVGTLSDFINTGKV